MDGYYEFTGLPAGTYTVVEDDQNLPAGVTNGHTVMVGTINGQTVGAQGVDNLGDDEITQITITDGQTGVMYCFLDHCQMQPGPTKITGFVKCLNMPGEPGINGVTIRLYDAGGNLLATTTTHNQGGLDGYYEFTNLAPGTYRIVEDDQNLPAGATDANVIMVGTVNGVVDGMSGNDAQGNDFITNIRLQAGDMGMMYCFLENCNVTPPPAKISGFVNCIEMGGQGINGVTVRLFDAAGTLLATAVTHTQNGLDGYYEFLNLTPGTYRVVEDDQTLPAGDTDANQFTVGTVSGVVNGMGGQDAQGNDFITNIRLNAGDTGVNYSFHEHCVPGGVPSQYSGFVFCDNNGNGINDIGEQVFSNILIRLTGGNLTTPRFVRTGADGSYSFTGLAAGTYSIRLIDLPAPFRENGVLMRLVNIFNARPGTINGVQEQGTGGIGLLRDLVLPAGVSSILNNFPLLCASEHEPLSISGRVFYDTNHDCLLNAAGDRGLAGVPVRAVATDATGTVVFDQTTTTDANGQYAFVFTPGTPGGTYTFRITTVTPSGFIHEGQMAGNFGGVTSNNAISNIILTDGNNATEYNFCEELHNPPSKSDFLANGNSSGSGVQGTVDFGQVTINPTFNNINVAPRTGVRYLVTGADAGGGPLVRVFDFLNGNTIANFQAYDAAFRGGVRVATGDVNGDGIADIITAPGFGGGPVIRVFDGATFQMIAQFNAYDSSFRGGVYIAVGDINGDGRDEIITGAGEGGGPHVKVFSVSGTGANISVSQSVQFMAYDSAFRGGVRVAAADFNNDGFDDIVTGAGLGGGPHVKVFDLQQPANGSFALITQFMAFDAELPRRRLCGGGQPRPRRRERRRHPRHRGRTRRRRKHREGLQRRGLLAAHAVRRLPGQHRRRPRRPDGYRWRRPQRSARRLGPGQGFVRPSREHSRQSTARPRVLRSVRSLPRRRIRRGLVIAIEIWGRIVRPRDNLPRAFSFGQTIRLDIAAAISLLGTVTSHCRTPVEPPGDKAICQSDLNNWKHIDAALEPPLRRAIRRRIRADRPRPAVQNARSRAARHPANEIQTPCRKPRNPGCADCHHEHNRYVAVLHAGQRSRRRRNCPVSGDCIASL